MSDGFGYVTWWGFSPALNIIEQNKALADDKTEINVLLIGCSDARHVIKTMSELYKYPDIKVNFYIVEPQLELYARIILLLTIASEPSYEVSLQEKVELFMETFGNVSLRQQTCNYLERVSRFFIKGITDLEYFSDKLPLFDCSNLKFKERDLLEGIFKFWRDAPLDLFDSTKCWDLRLRKHLGQRFDSKLNVFDWDYSMKLCDRGADMIGRHTYLNWRKSGVAFSVRDGDYNLPNKTLASGRVLEYSGEKHCKRGYWGDIVVSPYICYGIETENEELVKKANKERIHNSQDITEYNLTGLLYSYEKKKPYNKQKETNKSSLSEINEYESNSDIEEAESEHIFIRTNNVKVIFLPVGDIDSLKHKSKYRNIFDFVYFSSSMVHLMDENVTNLLANRANITCETAKYITELTNDQCSQFITKIEELLDSRHFSKLKKSDCTMDSHLNFEYNR